MQRRLHRCKNPQEQPTNLPDGLKRELVFLEALLVGKLIGQEGYQKHDHLPNTNREMERFMQIRHKREHVGIDKNTYVDDRNPDKALHSLQLDGWCIRIGNVTFVFVTAVNHIENQQEQHRCGQPDIPYVG